MEKKDLHPLSDLEKYFKEYWLGHPLLQLELPCRDTSVKDLYETAHSRSLTGPDYYPTSHFDEDTYFEPGQDVTLVLHSRYMPAFWHEHNFFELLCILEGSCVNYINDTELTLSAGDLCFMAPGTSHALSVFSDECIAVNVIMRRSRFENSFFPLIEGEDILAAFFRHALYASAPTPYLLFRNLAEDNSLPGQYLMLAYEESLTGGDAGNRILNSLITVFFMSLLRNPKYRIEFPGVGDLTNHRNIVSIIEYLQENYENISQEELSSHFGYSTRQMTRLIKEATGKTFTEIIIYQRINKAKMLLREKDLPIEEVSEMSGFSSPNHFRKMFERQTGKTPSQYRALEI